MELTTIPQCTKGAELRRQLGDTEGGLKSLLEEARKAGLSVDGLGRAMDSIHADPAVKDQVIALYRTMAKEAEAAAAKTASLNDQYKQFSIALTGPAAAAKKAIVDALGVADQQLGKYNEALGQHREKLKQAVDDESKSWKALGEAAASASRTTDERLGEEFDRRRHRLEALSDAGLISERRKVQAVTWTLTFTSATNFTCTGASSGAVGTGSIGSDFAPVNSSFSQPYFTLKSAGWGGAWAAGESVVFKTHPAAAALWEKRVVPGMASFLSQNSTGLGVWGESE